METLAKRRDFLSAARGKKVSTPAFILQVRSRGDGSDKVRVGYTCSKKVGNAVARNRAKRRLREIARLVLRHEAREGYDYVLIGRRDSTARRNFADLTEDLRRALKQAHKA